MVVRIRLTLWMDQCCATQVHGLLIKLNRSLPIPLIQILHQQTLSLEREIEVQNPADFSVRWVI